MLPALLVLICLKSLGQTFNQIGTGYKPYMTLLRDSIVISTVDESSLTGNIKLYTIAPNDYFDSVYVESSGSFYGPAYMDSSAIVLHDHGLNGGGAAVYPNGTSNLKLDASNEGHDGWDASIKFLSAQNIHVGSIDGKQFNGIGLEYSHYDGSSWTTDTVGTSQIPYGFKTTIEIDDSGTPFIYYCNPTNRQLELATKKNSDWYIIPIDTLGDVGYFCDSEVKNDTTFLVYFNQIDNGTAGLRLSYIKDTNNVKTHIIDTLSGYNFGEMGVSPISLALYKDDLFILTSTLDDLILYQINIYTQNTLKVKLFSPEGGKKLNLCNSIKYHKNTQHISFGINGGAGKVMYRAWEPDVDNVFEFNPEFNIYPNPATTYVTIEGSFSKGEIFDSSGQLIKSIGKNTFSVANLSPGLYLIKTDNTVQKLIIK